MMPIRTVPSSGALEELTTPQLLARLREQRETVDAGLAAPARWRGVLRRQVFGHACTGDETRYVAAYDALVRRAQQPGWRLDLDELRSLHAQAAGDGTFRRGGLRVGDHHDFPPPAALDGLVGAALEASRLAVEEPALAALRLHLRLLAIHPFADGNGRTSRLAATGVLAAAGYRSSLFTAVEQHFHAAPRSYLRTLSDFQYRLIDEEACVRTLLQAMVAHSMFAAWFRERHIALRQRLAESTGLTGDAASDALLAFDAGTLPAAAQAGWVRQLGETPLSVLLDGCSARDKNELIFQVRRLLDEEAQDSATPAEGGITLAVAAAAACP